MKFIVDLLSSSSAHCDIVNKVGSKLSDKFVPICSVVGFVYSCYEIRLEYSDFKEIDRQFIGLALSSGMCDCNVRNCCLLFYLFIGCRHGKSSSESKSLVSSFY